MITLDLTAPPSVNAMYRNVPGRGRVKTGEYLSWANAHHYVAVQERIKAGAIKGKAAVQIRLGKLRAGSDIDNRAKACLDLLQASGIVENDSMIRDLHIFDDPTVKPGRVAVTVRAAG